MLSRSLFLVFFFFACGLLAQMTPSAPVLDFKFPKFGDNGFTEWVLEGGKGIYDSEEQIRIEDMALRVYSGDERLALEMTLDSPEATVRVQENRAFSEGSIVIVGSNFKISGVGWQWDGTTKQIELYFDVYVEFTQNLGTGFADQKEPPLASDTNDKELTVIRSERLRLTTTETEYKFEFENSVDATSRDLNLKSELLVALADAPAGNKRGSAKLEVDQIDAVREVVAKEQVVMTQENRVIRADLAEFYPRETRALLTGSAQVEAPGVYLSGQTISTREGEIVVSGSSEAGRSQMILLETGGLGIEGAAALSDETIILADSITMLEQNDRHAFLFKGGVEVMSGAVQMRSESMDILTKAAETTHLSENSPQTDQSEIKVGAVDKMVAAGGVRIERGRQIATGESVEFFPENSKAVLKGNPKVTSDQAVVTGGQMELQPGLALIQGSLESRIQVVLPELPDLGYEGLGGASEISDRPENGSVDETVIQSVTLRMIEEPTQTVFRFTDDVRVKATNLVATCDELEVVAIQNKAKNQNESAEKDLKVTEILAEGSVVVEQSGRVATAERAQILPNSGRVILEGNAVVKDERGQVSGHRMILNKGNRNAIVEGGDTGQRNKITLSEMKTKF